MTSQAKPHREAERRFLVSDRSVLDGLTGNYIKQGYLFSAGGWKGRVRQEISLGADGQSRELEPVFTVKGPKVDYVSTEYSLTITPEDAEALLVSAAPAVIEKVRIPLISEDEAWDVDWFMGRNDGLTVAEFEGSFESVSKMRRPWWCSREITDDPRYFNENLAANPWSTWNLPHDDEAK